MNISYGIVSQALAACRYFMSSTSIKRDASLGSPACSSAGMWTLAAAPAQHPPRCPAGSFWHQLDTSMGEDTTGNAPGWLYHGPQQPLSCVCRVLSAGRWGELMSCCVNWLVQGVGVTRSTGTGPRAVVQAPNVHGLLLLCPSVLPAASAAAYCEGS